MTEANTSDAIESALAKKVKSASFDIENFPLLMGLSSFVGKASAMSIADAAKVDVQPLETKATMRNAQAALGGLCEKTNYYWFGDHSDERALLVGLSPSFLSAMSEALLGGGFALSDEEVTATELDSELAQMFVFDIVDRIVKHVAEKLPSVRPEEFSFKKSAASSVSILKGVHTSALFNMSIEVMIEEENLSSFLTFHFPIEYLEQKGMLAPATKSRMNSSANTQWYADMLENVHHTAIELPVMIGKYNMTLSELSKLEVGQIIPLEENAHNSLDVILKSDQGIFTLCKGKLGTFKENKAVKVLSQPCVA